MDKGSENANMRWWMIALVMFVAPIAYAQWQPKGKHPELRMLDVCLVTAACWGCCVGMIFAKLL